METCGNFREEHKERNNKFLLDFYKFLRISKSPSLFLSLVSGILLGLPFCDGRLWIFAWFGFVPLFLAIQNKSRAKAFFLSYLTGLIFWSITIYWLIHVTLLGQILLVLYLSLYFGIFGFAIRYPLSAIRFVFIPSLWVLLEYLRSHLLSGFGWALLGYSQYLNLPIIQIADLFGVYGVSFLVMMVNAGIYSVTSHKLQVASHRRSLSLLFSLLCLFLSFSYGFYKLTRPSSLIPRPSFRVSVIQGNIPQELKWAIDWQPLILDRYARLTKEAALEEPDIIIWPEASSPGFWGEPQDEWILETIFSLAKKTNVPLLFGSVVREEGKYFNSALLIDEEGKPAGRYDKLHLVPFGEYIPFKHIFKFLATIVPIGDFTAGKEYTFFKLPITSDQLPGASYLSQVTGYRSQVAFAVLICFEDTIHKLSRSFVKKGARFLVNITNDAWFGNTRAPYQHLSASVFRAVENRVPLVRAANTGVSCVIDSQGKIAAKVSQGLKDIFVPGIKTAKIILSGPRSLYSNLGDLFVLACLALVIFCAIITQNPEPRT